MSTNSTLAGTITSVFTNLASGASRSLRVDTQGKTLALALLQMQIETPQGIVAMLRQ